MKRWFKNTWIKVLIGVGLSVILVAMISNLFFERKINIIYTVTHDIKQLEHALRKIHADCEIVKFTALKNPLTFLNVVKFVGSEIGTVNLAYPERFKGPYLQDNPSLYGIEYQVIKTKNGLFIVPGDGVTLPNGKEIGKDIIFTRKSNVEKMLHDETTLLYKKQSLGKKLDLEKSATETIESPEEKGFDIIAEEYMVEE